MVSSAVLTCNENKKSCISLTALTTFPSVQIASDRIHILHHNHLPTHPHFSISQVQISFNVFVSPPLVPDHVTVIFRGQR